MSDTPATYTEWRRLVVAHGVLGVQVHDTRLAALMNTNGISHLLTLNAGDFARFPGLTAYTPADVMTSAHPRPP